MYLDVYLLENVLTCQVLLIFTLILMGRRIRFIRLLMASMVWGAGSVLMIVLHVSYGMLYILFTLTIGITAVTLASGMGSIAEQITGTLYYVVLSFAWNRLFNGMERILGMRYTLCTAMVITVMGMVIGYLCYRKRYKKQIIYEVEIKQQGRRLAVKALVDTGNALREPVSGSPVSVMEKTAYDRLGQEPIPERCKVIPYHSIGKAHGMLQGTQVDELIIWRGSRPQVQKNAVIALYEGKLSGNGSYQMILHASLL